MSASESNPATSEGAAVTPPPSPVQCNECGKAFTREPLSRRHSCSDECAKARRLARERERGRTGHRTAYLRDWHLRRNYGIGSRGFDALLAAQGGGCGICRVTPDDAELVVDHDHACCPSKGRSCGRCIRGLLCHHCNRAIGGLGDDPARLRAAADYLERYES